MVEHHPDFVRIRREEGAREIVVKQARELLARMQLTSAYGGYKVALIEEADRLNEEAANALLKAVEEPSAHTIYIFLAEQPDRLPAYFWYVLYCRPATHPCGLWDYCTSGNLPWASLFSH
jgi:DNA polymerase III delta prime subunit